MAVRVQDTILPKNDADFPVVDSSSIKGGHQEVANATARDAITASHRSIGMFVTTQDDGKVWKLGNDLLTWTEFTGGGGGGFTAGGDLTGTSTNQTVAAIQGIPSMDPVFKADRDLVEIKSTTTTSGITLNLASPRDIVSDGTHIYVAQNGQNAPIAGSQNVWKLTMSGGTVTAAVACDLTAGPLGLVTVVRCRGIEQDATYLYVATWNAQNIAIIDKATMTLVGWGYTGGTSAMSVCADGAGNFYACNDFSEIWKFSTAACIGAAPNTVTPVLTLLPNGGTSFARWITYGGGFIWAASPGGYLAKIDPTTLTEVTVVTDVNGDTALMVARYAFGALWVASNNSTGIIYKVDPTTLTWITTISGFAHPSTPMFGTIPNIIEGPDDLGNPNAWLWVCSMEQKFGGPYVAAVDPVGLVLASSTYQPSANNRDAYEGLCVVGNYVYAGGFDSSWGPSTPHIGYVNAVTSASGKVTGSSTTTTTWALGYKPIDGDLSGPIDKNSVHYLRGVAVPDPAGVVTGYVPTLAQSTFPLLNAIAWDSSHQKMWVGLAGDTAGAVFSYDPTTTIGAYHTPSDPGYAVISQYLAVAVDANYVFVAGRSTFAGLSANIFALDKLTGAVVGVAAFYRASSLYSDGTYLWAVTNQGFSAGLAKISIAAMIAAGPTGSPPAATASLLMTGLQGVTGDGTWVYVSNNNTSNIHRIDPATALVSASYADPAVSGVYGLVMAGGHVWCAAYDHVLEVDPAGMTLVSTTPLGTFNITSIAYDGTRVWAGSLSTRDIFGLTVPGGGLAYTITPTDISDNHKSLAYDGTYLWGVGNTSTTDAITRFTDPAGVENLRYFGPWRLDYAAAGGTLAGDVTGAPGANTVTRLQGFTVNSAVPTVGAALVWQFPAGWTPTTPGGDLSGSSFATPTVARINGYTVSATPTLSGQVLTWNGSAWVAQAVGGSNPGTPQTGNNYAPVKVNVSGAAIQSWINLNGGTGYRSDLVDGDVDGMLQASQVSGAAGAPMKAARSTVDDMTQQMAPPLVSGGTGQGPKADGYTLQIVSGTNPQGIANDASTGVVAITRSGCDDTYFMSGSSTGATRAPRVISLETDLTDETAQGVRPAITGKTVFRNGLAYAVKEYAGSRQYVVEVDYARGTARKVVTNITSSLREMFLDSAWKTSSQSGDSDVYACWYKGFGNDYWLQGVSYSTATAASVTVAGGVTITAMCVAQPVGGYASPGGRIYLGQSDGTIQEWDGTVNPPVFVRTLSDASISGSPIVAMRPIFFNASNQWLHAINAAGVLARFHIVTNVFQASLSTGLTNAVDITIAPNRICLVIANATSLRSITSPTGAMALSTLLTPVKFGTISSFNFKALAQSTTGGGSYNLWVADQTNGLWKANINSGSGVLTWDGLYNGFYDISGLSRWAKPNINFDDPEHYTGSLPVRNMMGGNRLGGAYCLTPAYKLTVGKTLKVVSGTGPTEIFPGYVSRPGSKDIIQLYMAPGAGTYSGAVIPLTGAWADAYGLGNPPDEITANGLWALNSSYSSVFTMDQYGRLFSFSVDGTTGRGSSFAARLLFTGLNPIGGGPGGVMDTDASNGGRFFLLAGRTVSLIDATYNSYRRETLVWSVNIHLNLTGGELPTSICSLSTYVYVSTDQGHVLQFNASDGSYVRTVNASETGAGASIVKIVSDTSAGKIYWITGGALKQFNRLTGNTAAIDGTGTLTLGVTARDLSHNNGSVGSGFERLAILTATGIVWLNGFQTGTPPTVYTPTPDNTTTIVGAISLGHITYNGLGTWWATDTGGDVLWEIGMNTFTNVATLTSYAISGLVDYV